MHQSYSYEHHHVTRYTFISVGRKRIEKVVEFEETIIKDSYNLALGDLQSDGSVDDKANSNNGDLMKVLATVINILKDFTAIHPQACITFLGNTKERTKLYTRIIRTYYSVFNKEFMINVLIEVSDTVEEFPFDPHANQECLLFLIKRIR